MGVLLAARHAGDLVKRHFVLRHTEIVLRGLPRKKKWKKKWQMKNENMRKMKNETWKHGGALSAHALEFQKKMKKNEKKWKYEKNEKWNMKTRRGTLRARIRVAGTCSLRHLVSLFLSLCHLISLFLSLRHLISLFLSLCHLFHDFECDKRGKKEKKKKRVCSGRVPETSFPLSWLPVRRPTLKHDRVCVSSLTIECVLLL